MHRYVLIGASLGEGKISAAAPISGNNAHVDPAGWRVREWISFSGIFGPLIKHRDKYIGLIAARTLVLLCCVDYVK